jgi:hypothetical protein
MTTPGIVRRAFADVGDASRHEEISSRRRRGRGLARGRLVDPQHVVGLLGQAVRVGPTA